MTNLLSKQAGDYAIGLDIGGTNVKTVVVSPAGETLEAFHAATAHGSVRELIASVRSILDRIESACGPAAAVGIASPGLAARDERSISWMMGRMEAIMGVDWTVELGRKEFVPVINDAHAALFGERWRGAAVDVRDAVMLTLGTGVGGAVICDGHMLRGHLGRAGHLGHVTVNAEGKRDIVNTPGSLEDAIGECTLAERSAGRFGSSRELVEAYEAGDAAARKIWLTSVRHLAAGLVGIINAVDPEVVIIGGGLAKAGDALFAPLAENMNEFEWRPTQQKVRIVPAALGDRAGALGAAWRGLAASQVNGFTTGGVS